MKRKKGRKGKGKKKGREEEKRKEDFFLLGGEIRGRKGEKGEKRTTLSLE